MKVRSVLIGGWEFTKDDGIDQEIAKLAGGKILFIPDASKFPEKQIDRATIKYNNYNTKILLLNENLKSIPKGIKVIYLGGGQPEKLMEYFHNNPSLLKEIKGKWLKGEIILCGSSTGAMVQFKEMLAEDSRGKGNANLIPGLGLIKNNAFVAPHWNEPDGSAQWREKILEAHKEKLIITVDEYTGLFWGEDKAKVVGLGGVNIASNGKIRNYKNGEAIPTLPILT